MGGSILKERFLKVHSPDEEDKRITKIWDMDFYISRDHNMALRKFNFRIEDITRKAMEIYKVTSDPDVHGQRSIWELEVALRNRLDDMLNNDEIITYQRILTPDKFDYEKSYSLYPEKNFGYAGQYLQDLLKMSGKDVSIFIPNEAFVCYAIYGEYILLISPLLSDDREYTLLESVAETGFDDDLW